MSHENLLKWSQTPFDSATHHFSKIFTQVDELAIIKNSELEVVSNFFEEFGKIERTYKDELVTVCVKYQKQVYEAFSDEKMQQFFQMLFNNLLHRSEKITRDQGFFKDLMLKMRAMNQEFKKSIQTKVEYLRQEKAFYDELLETRKIDYSDYLKKCDTINENTHNKIDLFLDEADEVDLLIERVRNAEEKDERLKMLEKVADFKVNLGKRAAQKLKDKFREQRGKNKWTNNELERFDLKWRELAGVVANKVEDRKKYLKEQEKSIVAKMEQLIENLSNQEKERHNELSDSMFSYLGRMEKTLQEFKDCELDWKEKVKSLIVQFMYNYFPEKKEKILKKAKNTEENMEGFKSKFYDIAKVIECL
jgi:hypothetical protein